MADPFVGSMLSVNSGQVQYDSIDIDNQNSVGYGINVFGASLMAGDTSVDLISSGSYLAGIANTHGTLDLGNTTVNASSPSFLQGFSSDGNSSLDSLSININSEDDLAIGLYLLDSNAANQQNNNFSVAGQATIEVTAADSAYGILSLNGDGYGNGQTD